mmetsp:Transcript_47717/g.136285  ORF Transcript_47717/g.136285 Transcript_47717/m.136285 type:complete len:237 (+) Transcript_47717:782-1492(+)
MFCSLLSSLCAIFCASWLRRAFLKDSRNAAMSSSSSSWSSASSSSASPGLPVLSFRISRCSSCSWRRRTVSRSSSSVRFCILELISWESRCTSATRFTRSSTSSRRPATSKASRTRWRSATESCCRPAAIMSASTAAELGQRTRFPAPKRPRSAPPRPWGSRRSSWTSCCRRCASARASAPSSRSSTSLTVATRKGEVCVKACTSKRDWPSTCSVTTLSSLSPTFVVLCAWDAMRQ